jgi:outer membrane immunogenic protein
MRNSKFIISAAFAVSAIVGINTASAADMPVKVPVAAEPPVYSWTGGYAGISLGGRWADTPWTTNFIGFFMPPIGFQVPADPTTTPASFNSSTFRGGGYIGYNWQVAPLWVVGVEADVAWGRNDKTLLGIPGTFGTSGQGAGPGAVAFDSSNVRLGWDGSLRERVGFLVTPTWLLYATGGLTWQQADINATCFGSSTNASWCSAVHNETFSTTRIGWTVGAGAEALIRANWLLRAEYRYSDYGNIGHTFFANTLDQVVMNESLRTHVGLVGLAYKFGGM